MYEIKKIYIHTCNFLLRIFLFVTVVMVTIYIFSRVGLHRGAKMYRGWDNWIKSWRERISSRLIKRLYLVLKLNDLISLNLIGLFWTHIYIIKFILICFYSKSIIQKYTNASCGLGVRTMLFIVAVINC